MHISTNSVLKNAETIICHVLVIDVCHNYRRNLFNTTFKIFSSNCTINHDGPASPELYWLRPGEERDRRRKVKSGRVGE